MTTFKLKVHLMNKKEGFTLVEMMITLAIAAILLTMAVPSFQAFIENNRLATNANNLISMMQYTKYEAVKRNATVSLCAGDTTNGCVCNAQAGCDANWRNGYIVFNDPNSNCIVNNGEQILRVDEGIRGDYTITATGCLTYRALGNLSTNNTVNITFCTSRITADNIRNIQVNPVGRPRVQKSTGSCS